MKLTKYGIKDLITWGIFAFLIISSLVVGSFYFQRILLLAVALFVSILFLCYASIFRDPYREINKKSNILLSPADGVINEIELLKDSDENQFFEGKNIIKVGIYVSKWDVHINRIPCKLEVIDKKDGESDSTNTKTSIEEKDSKAITIFCNATVIDKLFPIIIRQISCRTSKKIVCSLNENEHLEKGDKFGMIKSQARVELYLPAESWMELKVKVGNKVYAGKSIIAKITNQEKKPKNA